MSAIIANFQIVLTKNQAAEIRRKFQKACKAAGTQKAAMLAQPKTQWQGLACAEAKIPTLDCCVITGELFTEISAVIASKRPTTAC